MHADTRPQAPDPSSIPPVAPVSRTDPAAPDPPAGADASSRKRLLIRVQVEGGRVVSESSHYAED